MTVKVSTFPSRASVTGANFLPRQPEQTSRGGKTLVPGLLAEVHVAVVPREALLPAMEDCLPALAEEIPRNISFITGPGKTADIEQTMTVGAHGPRKVIVVLL